MHLEVFLAVIIGELFSGLDGAEGEEVYATGADIDLAVRCARMVDEAGLVRGYVAVDHRGIRRPEEILPAVLLDLLRGGRASRVFDDTGSFRYTLFGEETATAMRAPHVERERKGLEAALHRGRIPSFIQTQSSTVRLRK